ncbi:MAG: signal recognition particle-docking protein FtsY [Bacillota bacterium]|nr:signal recognition particle-docking protein FtsY [Bacillota bacterium]
MEGGGILAKLRQGLARTREGLRSRLGELIAGSRLLDQEFFDELEAILLQADVGVSTTDKILEQLKERLKAERISEPAAARAALKTIIRGLLPPGPSELARPAAGPAVIMVVGVNGTGKTTTVGKLAHLLREQGAKVILGAADTFRAAATEQLSVWAQRAGVEVISQRSGSDPAAVAFDAAKAAVARRADYLLIDTAGRLHTKENLMAELQKVSRVLGREIQGAPHEVLLVLDATTGQNALTQARIFGEAVGVTGIVLTKLDGTAKGGVVIGIADSQGVPVKYVGLGEGVDDLRSFEPDLFVAALFEEAEEEKEG